jgi:hypothetical protein
MITSTSAPRSDHLCRSIIAIKSWFTMLRLYSPLEPWFGKTWQPGEIEMLNQ